MNRMSIISAVVVLCLNPFSSFIHALTLGARGAPATDTSASSLELLLPPGKFTGDDIQINLAPQGQFTISGAAVGKPLHGVWTVEKKDKRVLLYLTPNSKKEEPWLFGVRSPTTLQLVSEDNLKVLDRPLNIYEDAGVLTRDK